MTAEIQIIRRSPAFAELRRGKQSAATEEARKMSI
jgi:hypothetical protein